ncbi:hypothetical protein G9F32_04750 [Acinetobacter sp. 194]|uniref:hypothetical protein n=1 Tax=Acinetobacter shaoyimingii TaxID=2715164 RepID=UPI00140C35EE|nr:hypothetical protein [Acinetobacter shaoyimingii]NHB57344.1 hypothetical protein [Acinetobacter shaoyimingii]
MNSKILTSKIEYKEFDKSLKLSSFSVIFTFLFIYISQFLSKSYILNVLDLAIAVILVSSILIFLIKSINLIKVINSDLDNKYENIIVKKPLGYFLLFIIFIIGISTIFIETDYRISLNIISVFLISTPIVSIYMFFNKKITQ